MGVPVDKIFVNLPVKNLQKSIDFFTKIGFDFNAQFTSENGTCMIITESIYAMLLVEPFFKTFTSKQIIDAANSTEAIFALSATSREAVDEIVNKAMAAGGQAFNEPNDQGFMYGWSFQDLDNHLWEVFYMDPSVVNPA